jgi:hypothetical protein
VGWSGTEIANPLLASTTVTVDSAKTVSANFAIHTYALTYTAGPNGSLTGNQNQIIDHGSDGSAITAVPASGYSFLNWSDGGTANPRTDTGITSDRSIMANFEIINPDANNNGILDSWEIIKFGNADPGNNPADDDADGDGLSNLAEYALDTHPRVPNASPLVQDFATIGEGRYLRLTVPKNPVATNLSFVVEVSPDLAAESWGRATTVVESDSQTELRVRDAAAVSSSTTRFMRLRVNVIQ